MFRNPAHKDRLAKRPGVRAGPKIHHFTATGLEHVLRSARHSTPRADRSVLSTGARTGYCNTMAAK